MSEKIPCTVAILTRNSAGTLARALEGVKDFSDIIVCDGASTDATLDIAQRYGANAILQSQAFLDETGRIKDFAGIRNQTLAAAKEQWFFFLDADEYVLPRFADALREVIRDSAYAYWVPRKYVLAGAIIDRSVGYPNRQMRLFHRTCVSGFRKPVHEKVVLKESSLMKEFPEPILVPIESSIEDQRTKNARYVAIELKRLAPLTFAVRARIVMHAAKIVMLYMARIVRDTLPPYRGARMPLRRDLEAIRYQCVLAWGACTA